MAFRSKNASRPLREMRYPADRWRQTGLRVVDNILDTKYFADLLPALAQEEPGLGDLLRS